MIVTMKDIWALPMIRKNFPDDVEKRGFNLHFVESLERKDLLNAVPELKSKGIASVVGLGGGQAIDVAKFFAWKLGCTLFQVPTALTVDAPWGHRAAVRDDGVVRYVGYAVPEAIYIDYDVLQSAPKELILSGIGDVLCFHTAHWDWKLADKKGKAGNFPFDKAMADQAYGVLENLLTHSKDIKALNDKGIKALVTALRYGGVLYLSDPADQPLKVKRERER